VSSARQQREVRADFRTQHAHEIVVEPLADQDRADDLGVDLQRLHRVQRNALGAGGAGQDALAAQRLFDAPDRAKVSRRRRFPGRVDDDPGNVGDLQRVDPGRRVRGPERRLQPRRAHRGGSPQGHPDGFALGNELGDPNQVAVLVLDERLDHPAHRRDLVDLAIDDHPGDQFARHAKTRPLHQRHQREHDDPQQPRGSEAGHERRDRRFQGTGKRQPAGSLTASRRGERR
jgi:hypothetical protein